MAATPVNIKSSKKVKSGQEKIFREQTEKAIRSLASSFYEKSGIRAEQAIIDVVSAAAVDDILCAIREIPDFALKILAPEVATNSGALMEKLHQEVVKAANGEAPFGFISRGVPKPPGDTSVGCGKQKKQRAGG